MMENELGTIDQSYQKHIEDLKDATRFFQKETRVYGGEDDLGL